MTTTGYQVVPMYGIIKYDSTDENSISRVDGALSGMLFQGLDIAVGYYDEIDPSQGLNITINGGDTMRVGNTSSWILVDPFNNTVREISYPSPVFNLRGVLEWSANSDSHG